jgi:hypothetical protein
MIGRAPSGDLIQTFGDAIETFDDAVNVGNYDNFKQYLYPSKVLIQKVDDPGDFRYGNATSIIKYLNDEQAATSDFPLFTLGFPVARIYTSEKGEQIGNVTGNGTYQDTYTSTHPITVLYCLRFKQKSGDWLLASAFVTPI